MDANKQQFIKLCLDNQVLKFGDFTLKSGRKSHYFFNAGLFYANTALASLGNYYAELIHNNIINKIDFDSLFGPAYKGISIATSTAIALTNNYNFITNTAFNRKETKDHGEGGNIIGYNLENKKVLLIDDVISAGTATRESIKLLKNYNASIAAIVVALDRQEQAHNIKYKTAAEEITAEYNIPIFNIVNLLDVVEYTKNNSEYTRYTKLLEHN